MPPCVAQETQFFGGGAVWDIRHFQLIFSHLLWKLLALLIKDVEAVKFASGSASASRSIFFKASTSASFSASASLLNGCKGLRNQSRYANMGIKQKKMF